MNPFALQFRKPSQIAMLQSLAIVQDDVDYYTTVFALRNIYPSIESDLEVFMVGKYGSAENIPERLHNASVDFIHRQDFRSVSPATPSALGVVFSGWLNPDQIHRINNGQPWQEVVQELIKK